MKAVICTRYGPPEVLQMQELPKPTPKPGQILVKIISTTVNSGDARVRCLRVKGFMKLVMRLVLGISKPRNSILGTVFAGVVEAAGDKVSQFKVGDKVVGMRGFSFGTYAEYIAVDQNSNVIKMPMNASFDEAAAVVFGGHTAIGFLQKANIAAKPGQKVLVIGATGSVGIAAIQLAKHYRADLTAVGSSRGQHLLADLGVSKMILYDKVDFLQQTEKFDIIFDAVGVTNRKQCQKLLTKNGKYKNVNSYAAESKQQLQLVKTLFEKGAMQAVIDRTFQMDEIVEAHRYVDTCRKKGNVVLRISE